MLSPHAVTHMRNINYRCPAAGWPPVRAMICSPKPERAQASLSPWTHA